MSELLRRFKNLFTVNPNWSNSILPPNSFRVPSPGSYFGYSGAERKPTSYTEGYAYFKRDVRRLFPATIAITQRSVTCLLPVSDKIEALNSVAGKEPAVPGKRRIYTKADDQPPADGYFPIINCD